MATLFQNPESTNFLRHSRIPLLSCRQQLKASLGLMRSKRFVSVFVTVLGLVGMLSCGGTHVPPPAPVTPTGQILYVINSGTVTTYSIDANSLAATPVEQPVSVVPPPASLMQFDPSPDDHYLYVVWSDGQSLQHLSVFQTDSFGVPQLPAVQVLNADSLSQFNMHPSGKFAYMLEVTTSNNLYQAQIRLFDVQGSRGMLAENPKVQGIYAPAPYWPVFLYGFSTNGNQLYDTSTLTTGTSVYRQRSINSNNGFLGRDSQILLVSQENEVVLGQLIVEQYQAGGNPSLRYLNVYPNTPNPTKASIHCTMQMLSFCATANNIQLDPGGHYLFMTDPETQAVHIAAINLSGHKLTDTGNSIPMTSETPGFAFSPDGSIVYAMLAGDHNLHFYHFDKRSGSLSESSPPIPLALNSGICPALYQ